MNDHLEIEIIWGSQAVHKFQNQSDTTTWAEIEELGQIARYTFSTESELEAFLHGIDEASGWMDYYVIQPEDTLPHEA